ncbi:glycosyltransferase [Kutzneria sp. CA-103260]|uniref:glycosyltransferase n=1 Tax=Kutzneria sp. CA-103260 TaxID=2802641 RepID=UPI001BA886D4|nr:glycosyltransferase [Kutzneria sp. CA-103260]QUQ64961.1 glycosyl transferase family protein [Kutzneria sp. CA-103260]
MRVLFTSVPIFGHLYPMLPLARALRRRGDDVAFVGPPSVGGILAGEDVETLTAGIETPELIAEMSRRTGIDPLAGPIDVESEAEAFAAVRIDLSYDDTLAAARQWRPDVIIGDSYDYLGPIVAATLDVPHGHVTLGQQVRPEQLAALEPRSAARHTERDLTPRRPLFVADICPPDLQVDQWLKPEGWLPMRPETHRAADAPVPAPVIRGDRSRVLLTFGTLFGDPRVLGPVVNEVAALDIDLHVTLGPMAKAEDFDVDRERVTLEPFRPMADLINGTDVVVCHSGAGTTYAALAAGIPLVLMPQGADQFAVADRAAATGAALRLLPEEATPDRIRAAVTTVLSDPGYADRAGKVAAQIAAMPAATEVAESIAMLLD